MPEPLRDLTDIRRYSNALRRMSEQRMEVLTRQLVDGQIDLVTWQEGMKAELRRANLEQFVVGKGGDRELLDRKEYLQLGPELKRQYRYLSRFAEQLARKAEEGNSLEFAVQRAKLYARSTQASMWRSAVPVKLPQVPRDGQTACRTNCKCRLDIQYERDPETGAVIAVLVYWKLNPAEHCRDCLDLSRAWNPKRFPLAGVKEVASLEQAVGLLLIEAPELWEHRHTLYEMWNVEERNVWALTP